MADSAANTANVAMETYDPHQPLAYPGVQYTDRGLCLPDDLPYGIWASLGDTLRRMDRSIQWALADWLNFGETHYPDRYTQALDATHYEERGSLHNIAYVGRQYPNGDMRRDTLTFTHHAEVASLPPAVRDELLDRAEQERLTTKELRSEAIERKQAAKGIVTWIVDAAAEVTNQEQLEASTPDGRNVRAYAGGDVWFWDKAGRRWHVPDLDAFIREAYSLKSVLQRHFGVWPDKK